MLKKILTIAKWEYLEKVKTKTFIVSLILTPLLIISFSILPSLLFREEMPATEVIGVIDTSGIYFNYLDEELQKYTLPSGQRNYIIVNLAAKNNSFDEMLVSADKSVLNNLIKGYLLLLPMKGDTVLAEFRSNTYANFNIIGRLEKALNTIFIKLSLEKEGLRSSIINEIQDNIIIKSKKIEAAGKISESDFITTFFLSIVFILLLMMIVIYSGQMLVRNMIEEKSSRLIEVLISSITPDELLAGKVIGLSLLGLTQMIIWAFIGISLVGAAVIPVAAFKNVLPMLIYFILGFLFYTTLFVGIGSTVNTEQQAQQITTYLSLILMLPVVIAMPVIQNPDYIITKIFSYIPFTIPTVMVLRLNVQNVPSFELFISILILILSIIIVTKLSAKVFRIGILSHGNKLSAKEIFKWLKE